jgi:hypothetical protein
MENSITLEIYPDYGDKETITISGLTIEQANEYLERMEADTDFQFFRIWPDGSHSEIEIINGHLV